MIAYLLIPAAFLMGSIPFGFLIARAKGIDLRQHGSGNIGATNLGRVLGRPYFFLCFALDLTKGLTPSLLAGAALGTLGRMDIQATDAWVWLAVMFASPLGHIFCPWLGFKGGKGVATAMGSMIGVMPAMTIPAAGAFVVYIVVLLLWRMVGPASSLAAATLPLWTWYAFEQYETLQERRVGSQSQFSETPAGDIDQMVPNFGLPFFIVALALALVVIYKHKANLMRALAGTEPKLGESKPIQSADETDQASSDSSEPSA